MVSAPIPDNEADRQTVVESFGILDTDPEERFDHITKAATEKLKAPISTVSIIDKDREWYKSCVGVQAKEGKRDVSFCGHAMLATEVFVVEDTLLDDRFKDNPSVIGKPFIRFYAGVALHDKKTHLPIGVLCVKDIVPRKLSLTEMSVLIELAKQAESELNSSR
jgi:GAF domain-containing protein